MIDKLFPPYSWQSKLIVMAALCAASFLAGWTVHSWKTDAGITHTIAEDKKTRRSDEGSQSKIVSDKQEQQVLVKTVYKTIREKVYVQDDQSVCFTAESLQLWNDAIGANRDIYRRESAGESETAGASGGQQEEIDQGGDIVTTVRDTLSNAVDNFEICTDNSIKHLALIERVRSLQGKMCYCSK